ncbi:hypothetical protein [Latilactobacillus sakei]|uniref:hypothetical protein n=1 Tax=Latilactobacillus sakei TaxID=1599 RepID=UPI002073F123|nr:hypothetical protein [Latilactobacillus sakei]
MVHENDLQLPNWLQLSEQARRANFGQVLRYFVSPLVAIEGIQPEVVQAGRLTFKTYSAWFSGEQFVFIPAQSAVSLGWSLGADNWHRVNGLHKPIGNWLLTRGNSGQIRLM